MAVSSARPMRRPARGKDARQSRPWEPTESDAPELRDSVTDRHEWTPLTFTGADRLIVVAGD
jgi:hypothetical protein